MSINWVMLSDTEKFVRLPNERILYTSPSRTALSIQSLNSYPGHQPLSLSSSGGVAYITNIRIVYLPATPTEALKSFSSPILNLHDTHVSVPFFGPNVWTAALQPVNGGGIPAAHSLVEVKMTFKDGGAFDFHLNYEKVKELQHNAVRNAADAGERAGNLNFGNLTLEELPAYEESANRPLAASSAAQSTAPAPAPTEASSQALTGAPNSEPAAVSANAATSASSPARVESRPTEPPPGYEEVQRESVATELERRLRSAS